MSPVILGCPHFPDGLFLVSHLAGMFVSSDSPVVAIIVLEGVGFFAVDGIIAYFAHLVGHPKGHAADELDEYHDKGCPDDVPANDEECTDDLKTNLATIACNGTAGVSDTESLAAFHGCPET